MTDLVSPLAAPGFQNAHTFLLSAPEHELEAHGVIRTLPRGAADSLSDRVSEFFQTASDGPALLVGAVPFASSDEDYLFQPARIGRLLGAKSGGDAASGSGRWMLRACPSAADYAESVARCVAALTDPAAATQVTKAVLSRSLELQSDSAIPVGQVINRLRRDSSVTVFRTPLPAKAATALVGATPELLLSKKAELAVSYPLAGSARRSSDPSADRQAARDLLASEKDQREHRITREMIFDTLGPYSIEITAPEGTTIRSTATMHHLGTRIVARLKDRATPVADLLSLLHPTPAVCGLPRREAADLISRLEGYDRGFYAGAVGWIDDQQDGEWYVSIRCAEISERRARVFAGAGIVPGSDPVKETEETSAKFTAMLTAFGIDEQGRPLQEFAA
ncbi:isochorismate synthase [Rhizobium rhizoryzae]|uniref:isochorismate synthase n=1 Tax=Rhizobium rhizoryzae TaxID=451876 RepID=UPI0028A08CDC|nr:isochorismate synthase [Rhizobium rhizoryzae]